MEFVKRSSIAEHIDERMLPLIKDLKRYFTDVVSISNLKDTVFAYHTDMGGIPSQAIMNKIALKYGQKPVSSYWSYEHPEPLKSLVNKVKPKHLVCLDMEPHESFHEEMKELETIAFLGHHIRRTDITELEEKTQGRVIYFNPLNYFNSNIYYFDCNNKKHTYDRGVPISYPLLNLAEDNEVDVGFIGSFGLRGYGFVKLAEDWETKRNIDLPSWKMISRHVDGASIVYSKSVESCNDVVKILTEVTSYKDPLLSSFSDHCELHKLYYSRDKSSGYSIANKISFGKDLAFFPVKSDFDQIKPIVSFVELKGGEKYKTRVFVQQRGPKIKFSVRAKKIDCEDLFRNVLSKMPIEQNFGGHKEAAGAVIPNSNGFPENTLNGIVEYLNEKLGKEYILSRDDMLNIIGIEKSKEQCCLFDF